MATQAQYNEAKDNISAVQKNISDFCKTLKDAGVFCGGIFNDPCDTPVDPGICATQKALLATYLQWKAEGVTIGPGSPSYIASQQEAEAKAKKKKIITNSLYILLSLALLILAYWAYNKFIAGKGNTGKIGITAKTTKV